MVTITAPSTLTLVLLLLLLLLLLLYYYYCCYYRYRVAENVHGDRPYSTDFWTGPFLLSSWMFL